MAEEKFKDIEELGYSVEYEPTNEELGLPEDEPEIVREKPEPESKKEPSRPAPERKPVARKPIPKPKKKVIVTKKTPKKPVKPRKESSGGSWTYIIAGIIAIVIVAALVYFLFFNKPTTTGKQADTVAVVVNGFPIYNSQLDAKLNFLRATTNPFLTKEEVLNKTIDETLMLQDAMAKGITTSDEEVSTALGQFYTRNQLTESQMAKDLETKGTNLSQLKLYFKEQLTLIKLLNDTIVSKVNLTEQDLRDYYNANKASFTIEPKVQVRHILIKTINGSDNDTYLKAFDVKNMIAKDKGNFCELVTNFTDDTASTSYCGEYNFSKQDPLVVEFLDAGFNMTPGEVRIVKTQFGYHIMWKISDIKGGQESYIEVKTQINQTLINKASMDAFTSYLEDLRSKAIIELYSEKAKAAVQIQTEPAVSIPTVENNTTATPQQDTSNTVVKETVQTAESKTVSLAKCLSTKGAKVYTTYWSPDSENQTALFGDAAQYLTVLECDSTAKDNQAEQCQSAGVTMYPSWTIDGKLYAGMASLRKLSTLSGCSY